MELWLANFLGKGQIFKEGYVNSEIGSGFFPKMLPFGQNVQNEVSLQRSIFADVVAYQFINLN